MKIIKYYFISAIVFFAGFAYAQTSEEITGIPYVVQPGDTLYDIAKDRLEGSEQWVKIAEAENIKNPLILQPGRVISLPVDLLKHDDKLVLVAFQRGDNTVIIDGVIKPLTRGMALTEGQTVHTGADSFVSLELPDGSRLYLSANTTVRIERLRHVPEVDRQLIDFVVEEGHVETSVRPQVSSSRFRVSTPLMVTGVRGTNFGVSYDRKDRVHTNNVTEGSVGVVMADGTRSRSVTRNAQQPIVLDAGQSAVLTAGMTAPRVGELLPAPELSSWPGYIHETKWTPVLEKGDSVTGFSVRVSPEKDETNVVFESRGALKTIGPLYEDGVYQVQVRALDKDGIPGYPAVHLLTVKTKPAAPLLQSPADAAQLPIGEQTLLCTNTANIWRYYLQVAKDAEFSDVIDEQMSTEGCTFTLRVRETGDYFWRVAALDGASRNIDSVRGEYSAIGEFEVVVAPAVPAVMQERTANVTTLRWPEVVPGSEYVIEIADKMDFSNVVFSQKTHQTEAFVELPSSCNALYVRMQSISPQGFVSDFSDVRVLQGTPTWCTGDGSLLVDGQGKPINMQ